MSEWLVKIGLFLESFGTWAYQNWLVIVLVLLGLLAIMLFNAFKKPEYEGDIKKKADAKKNRKKPWE